MTASMDFEARQNYQTTVTTKGKVLVVDDEDYVRSIVGVMLESMGYEAIEASDGDGGLKAYDDNKDVVACIIDLSMPGMAGMELLARIRKLNSGVPVLLVSGYSRHEVRQEETKSAHLSFLQKPFTMEQFRTAMNAQFAATAQGEIPLAPSVG